jgi:hypothetical protein
MNLYEVQALKELQNWKVSIKKEPTAFAKTAKGFQNKVNNLLPDKYHEIITTGIKNLTKSVLSGAQYVSKPPLQISSLEERELLVKDKTKFYTTTAVLEGAATGAGGLLLGLADFPLLLGIKIKYLYDVASIYGFDTSDYKERLYLLSIFQLAFSSQEQVHDVFSHMEDWKIYQQTLPNDINDFDWRTFQQEYRDYIDVAKLLQLVPGIGAFVGIYVNHNLMQKLSETAMQAYRMRLLE